VKPLQFSAHDGTFRKVPHEVSLAIIRALGFTCVDICVFHLYEHITPDLVLDNPSAAACTTRNRVNAAGLEIADVFFIFDDDFEALTVNHPDTTERRRSRDAFSRGLEFTLELGVARMTILPGINWKGEPPKESLARATAELGWRTREAGEQGVTLGVEPHLGSVADTIDAALELAERVPGLTYTLDLAHYIYSGIGQRAVYRLFPYTGHFHARQAAKGRMQTPVASGEIDFTDALRALVGAGYRGGLALEYVYEPWMGCNEADCVAETVILRTELARALVDLGVPGVELPFATKPFNT
jgi:sugar phosphate isomerase/epimerase